MAEMKGDLVNVKSIGLCLQAPDTLELAGIQRRRAELERIIADCDAAAKEDPAKGSEAGGPAAVQGLAQALREQPATIRVGLEAQEIECVDIQETRFKLSAHVNRGLMAAGLLLAVLWVVSAESAWAADEEPKVILPCVPMKPPRALDALTTEAWVAELREGPVQELTQAGEKAAPILAAALKDPRAAGWTRHMLISVKGDRQWTVPVLAAGLDNPDRNERGWSLGALKRLGPDAANAVPAVVAALTSWCADGRLPDAEEQNGRDAIELLGQIGPAAREAVDLLVAIFESEPTMPTPGRGSCRFEVMKTLGQIGPDAMPAVCDMVGRNTDDPQGFSMRTNLTYYRPETLRPLLEHLSSKQVHRRRGAVGIVAVHVRDKQRLPADKELAAALIPLLEDDDFYVRRAASEALEMIDGKPNPKADKLGKEEVE
jgi:hypothetical protein